MVDDARFDVMVIGGGHAGCEAAAAAARMGARTAMVTQKIDSIGVMSCNPAIGGLGKGHLVREIDALGGLMPKVADAAGIQFRLLNRSKGPAVRGPRAQADRAVYRAVMQQHLVAQPNLELIEGEAAGLIWTEQGDDKRITGLALADGRRFVSATVVVATGTFLRGVIHVGRSQTPAGRAGDQASINLAQCFDALKAPLGRLKTGTPPRLDGRTIRWDEVEMQPGDERPEMFSLMSASPALRQVSCGLTRTTSRTHDIVRANLHLSAMHTGEITGRGPRYCPSIEDKIVRFGDRDGHQIFLEPEGLNDHLVYPNGLSTSLPADVQADIVRSIPGLQDAEIARSGYAIEYDYIDPRALDPTLECRLMRGLFLAGQINGTTGYEEAGAQGLLAGVNAALHARGDDLVVLERSRSYIGVMVDDLVSRGVTEPYRMFTSRSEFRLTLRIDNADDRLGPLAQHLGLTGPDRHALLLEQQRQMIRLRDRLQAMTVSAADAARLGVTVSRDGQRRSGWQMLSHPEMSFEMLLQLSPGLASDIEPRLIERVVSEAIYEVYLARQSEDIAVYERDRQIILPEGFDVTDVPGLSNELKAKLSAAPPRTLDQASRMEGMTPAALAILAIHARKLRKTAAKPRHSP